MFEFNAILARAQGRAHPNGQGANMWFIIGLWRIIQMVIRILFIAAIIVGGLSLAALVAIEFQNKQIDSQTAGGLLATFNLLVIIAVLSAAYLLVAKLYSLPKVLGTSWMARLVGVAVAAYFFPQVVTRFFVEPIRLVTRLVQTIPSGLGQQLGTAPPRSVDEILRVAILMLQVAATQFALAVQGLFESFFVPDFALALALAILVGHLFSFRELAASEPNLLATSLLSGGKIIVTSISSISNETRRSLFLFSVLMVATYLSVVAVVSIPWLKQDDGGKEVSSERLQQRLATVVQPDRLFNDNFPANYASDLPNPFSLIENALAQKRGGLVEQPAASKTQPADNEPVVSAEQVAQEENAPSAEATNDAPPRTGATQSIDESIARSSRALEQLVRQGLDQDIDDSLTRQRSIRDQLINRWAQLRSEVIAKVTSQSSIISTFESNMLSPRSRPERVAYFQNTAAWYERSMNSLYFKLNNLKAEFRKDDAEWGNWSKRTAEAIGARPSERNQTVDFRSLRISVPRAPIDEDVVDRFDPDSEFPPSPGQPGFGWGIIGSLASWLLVTESPELIQIVGMLGFGLLGATIAAFIRKGSGGSPSDIPFRDELGVLIGGFSAALVLFLGVKGSLTAFTSSTSEPNSYVVFFLSLVGAYYSEDVWDWAHRSLRDRQNRPQSGTNDLNVKSGVTTTSTNDASAATAATT